MIAIITTALSGLNVDNFCFAVANQGATLHYCAALILLLACESHNADSANQRLTLKADCTSMCAKASLACQKSIINHKRLAGHSKVLQGVSKPAS